MRNLGPETFNIHLIENFPCNSEEELERFEFHHSSEVENPEKNLFNSDLVYGKRSSETIEKVKLAWTEEKRLEQSQAQTGVKNSRFSGGCVIHYEKDRIYRAAVCGNKKSFGYGSKSNRSQDQAKQLAEEWRVKEVAKLTNSTTPAVNE
jgi:hypothetical protein